MFPKGMNFPHWATKEEAESSGMQLTFSDWISVKQKAQLKAPSAVAAASFAARQQTFVAWGALPGWVKPSLSCGLFALTTESLCFVFSACRAASAACWTPWPGLALGVRRPCCPLQNMPRDVGRSECAWTSTSPTQTRCLPPISAGGNALTCGGVLSGEIGRVLYLFVL